MLRLHCKYIEKIFMILEKIMKKLLSFLVCACVLFMSISMCVCVTVSAAAISLTPEQIKDKNYPLPKGYEVANVYGVYDTSVNGGNGTLCSEEGNYYDQSSLSIVSKQGAYEKIGVSNAKLDGIGFMFWYKTDIRHTVRIRSTVNNSILAELYLDPTTTGRWVTFYYYGSYTNCSFKGDMSSDLRPNIKDVNYNVHFMTSTGNKTIYIDEFYTFKAGITPADTYETDEQAFKFSLNRFVQGSKYVTDYEDDGSVSISSTYGSSANTAPFSVIYKSDAEQFKLAVDKAKLGSGYLQMQVENINCVTSTDKEAYALITVTFDGVDKTIKQYIYGSGTTDTMLLNIEDIESPESITNITLKVTGTSAIKDVKFKFSPLTVFYYPEDEIILQAEDLDPKYNDSTNASIVKNSDGNRTYVYNNSSSNTIAFTLPELEVGEYYVYAGIYAKVCSTKYQIALNNLRQLVDIPFTDENYSSQYHNTTSPIGTIKITKDYSDGPTVLKMICKPKATAEIRVDYFSFKKMDTETHAEPSSNFVIKDYPTMENYEVKTVLSTFDSYICGSDERYYLNNQLAGYVGDDNAFNLNSRGTLNWAYSDNNVIWAGNEKHLDGDAIRFWFKGSGGTLQFLNKNRAVKYTYNLPWASTGTWIVVYYKNLVSNGDLTDIYNIYYKTGGNKNANYIDELHTIQEKLGDVVYELNGDGTASVTGYNLRLEDVVIQSEYKGCPVVSIKENAFKNSLALKSVVLPDTLKQIGNNAFDGCLNLTSIDLANVESIGGNTFLDCKKLTNLTVPDECLDISESAFTNCALLYVNVTNGTYIKDYCIEQNIDYTCVSADGYEYYCDFNATENKVLITGYFGEEKNLTVPEKIDSVVVREIDESCFEGLDIVLVVLPECVTTVDKNAFKNCTSLQNVSINGVQKIGESAFYNCSALEFAECSDELSSIGNNAFYQCTELLEFYFGDSLSSVGTDAFYAAQLTAILSDNACLERTSYSYKYVNTNLFPFYPKTDSDYKYFVVNYVASIYKYTGESQTLVIPSVIDDYPVEAVEKDTFKNNKNIKSVTFTGKVRYIYENAFDGCSSLSVVNFNDDLRRLFDYSFANCTSLKEISINKVVLIDSKAFFGSPTTINYIETNFIRNAKDYVDGMTAGWNLGNTLDAHSTNYSYGDLTVSQHEHLTRWYNYISQGLFDLVVQNFNTIRIPITWNVFIDPNNDYAVDKAFMDRIQEVVDMCYLAGFEYIIINTHHDSDYYFNVHPSNPDYNNAEYILGRVWEQISERFKDYDEKLIFESMNEIRAQDLTTTEDGNGDWYGHDTTYFDKLNSLNKEFYKVVRASGGNNTARYLMIQTYGGQKDFYQINKLWLPSVSEDDHIIPSVHWYIESTNPAHYYATLDGLTQKFLDKGMPCVIGEIGLARWITDDQREIWANNAFGLFEDYNIKAIIWEDHGDYSTIDYNGGNYIWKYPKYVETIYQLTRVDKLEVSYDVIIDGTVYSSTGWGDYLALPESSATGFVSYTDGTNLYQPGDLICIKENLNLTILSTGDISMQKGAAIRFNQVTGLRFTTKLDVQNVDLLKSAGYTVTLGTLIAPIDLLDSAESLTFDSEKYLDVVTSGYYNEYQGTIVGSIVSIKEENYERKFVGRGYIKVEKEGEETKVFYASLNETDNARSIFSIASSVLEDDFLLSSYTTEQIEFLRIWAKKE